MYGNVAAPVALLKETDTNAVAEALLTAGAEGGTAAAPLGCEGDAPLGLLKE